MNDKPYFTLRIPIPNRQYLSRLLRWLIPNGGTLLIAAVLILTQSVWARPFAATNTPGPSATTVNYQGRLADNDGVPLDGNYGMSFALYDAVSDGNLVWGPEVHDAVPVSDGLFSVGLGGRTTGGIPTMTWNGDRYLEITVGGETLSPRELIRSVPIAGMALTVPDGAIGTNQIANGAVTQITQMAILNGLTKSDQNWSAIPGLQTDFVVSSDETVAIHFNVTDTWNDTDGGGGNYRIVINGESKVQGVMGGANGYTANTRIPVTLLWSQNLVPGTYTVSAEWQIPSWATGSTQHIGLWGGARLIVERFKR